MVISEIIKNLNPNFNKLIFSAALLSIVAVSCKKDDNDKDTDTNSAKYDAVAQTVFNDMSDVSDQAATKGDLSGFKLDGSDGILTSCAVITIDTLSTPKVCIIDFGSGCTGNDGKTRAGKINVSFTGPYKQAGTVITITPVNYSVNGNVVSGSKTITNNGANSAGFLSYSVVVDGQIILAGNGGVITWQANRTREFIEGVNTSIFADDVYRISGSSTGTKISGSTWTTNITTSLVRKISCRQFVSGILTITPSNKPARTVDYGNGNCDNTATVTINGNTFTIGLL